ncbi:thiopurine S-methyltransferase [Rhodohalobacter sp. SW132]|uniref:thiopurine S-methyltransferase n=1 Tax=Rhodohalobacter sp. SW132 TaxID=2293433 RepID=UPI000E2889AD|nr:thiopurine S-methyltransferase [Rhodohalobacter sp. SW132]REL24765.1 thiopurine S-methyltransferase [Rhodohalobacter sp. SW132]
MELSYWQSRWKKGKTGFHMPDGYPSLEKQWPNLGLPEHPSVLVPLSGKSLDLIILEHLGATVTGVEISRVAIDDFMIENNRDYTMDQFAGFTLFRSGRITIWEGDFFKFPEKKNGKFDLIYDKAALVALPKPMRQRYAEKVLTIAGDTTPILLHHFIYPQEQMPGPPFSVPMEELQTYFAARYTFTLLEENTIPSKNSIPFVRRGLKSNLKEQLLLLNPLQNM